jgi:hypothetical protein
MKVIYSSAVQVVIWLGRYHETQDDMLEFDEDVWDLRSIKEGTKETTATVFKFMKSLSRRITKPEPGSELNRPFSDMLPRGTRDLANLKRLLMRPWFERLWVAQELLVAQQAQVICGRCSLSWSELEKACELLSRWTRGISLTESFTSKELLSSIPTFRVLSLAYLQHIPNRPLLAMLHLKQSAKCTDPRDRIYSLLGVCDNSQDFKVDYGKSVQDVYMHWTCAQIDITQRLDVFSACNNSKSIGLPSWVPDFERGFDLHRNDNFLFWSTVYYDPYTIHDFDGRILYAAAG